MKGCVFSRLAMSLAALACSISLPAQQTSLNSTTTVDINGNRVADGPTISQTEYADGSQTLVTTQSINGQTVPMEKVEQRVLQNDASGKVTERIVQRYDPQGNPLPPVRQVIEEHKKPDGGSTVETTTYTTNINGGTDVTEKSVTNTQKTATGETSETEVQRPTVNGLETVERQSEVVSQQGKDYQSESTTYRSDGNGGFYPAVRQTTDHAVQGSDVTENTAEYEKGPQGDLELHGQTVTKTVTQPDGLKNSVVNIYSANTPGVVSGSGAGLKLIEQDVIDNTPGPGNSVVQTVNVRRPTVSDPNTLGPEQQLSETVCKGNCKPPKDSGKP